MRWQQTHPPYRISGREEFFYPFPRKHRIKIQREKTPLSFFLWTFFGAVFYNENKSVSYIIGIIRDTVEEEYIRKPMKEGIKWRSDVFF